jgi:hypothetical protein
MRTRAENDNFFIAAVWMFLISVLLFWLPVVGPFIAGVVGGKKAGGVGAAIMASLIPALFAGIMLFFLASVLTGFPLLGFFAALGGFALTAAHIGPLILGAIIGGIMD